MAELENIIENLFSSPESMGKIMDIVKMFGGEEGKKEPEEQKNLPAIPVAAGQGAALDPAMVSKIMELLAGYNNLDDRRIRLLGAIRPYLGKEDSYHIDRAIEIVKLSHVAKSVLRDFLK